MAQSALDAVFSARADPTRRHVLQALAGRDSVTATGLAAKWIEAVGAEWDQRLGELRRSLER